MKNDRSKQILDKTFNHLEQVLEEIRQEKKRRVRPAEDVWTEKPVQRNKGQSPEV